MIPIGPQQVKLQLPPGKRAGKAHFLVGTAIPEVRRSGESIMLTVPSILSHEVIAIDFA